MNLDTREKLALCAGNPYLALEKEWVRDLAFCRAFFDHCEALALDAAHGAIAVARRAVEFAEAHGDPHLIHRGYGVLANAYFIRSDYFWATKTLEMVRDRALECCRRCRIDFLRRWGDLLGETRRLDDSLEALDDALRQADGLLSEDACARIRFVRGFSFHMKGERRRALRDMGQTLRDLSLESPQGFFMESCSMIAISSKGGGRRHDQRGLDYLAELSKRIRRRPDWRVTRSRLVWARGQLRARQGDAKLARRDLETACQHYVEEGRAREAAATSLDVAILLCRHEEPWGDNARTARRALTQCLEKRRDLPANLREGLVTLQDVLDRRPHDAFEELVAFRRSFITAVPSVMSERLAERRCEARRSIMEPAG